ncbi:hypothetical protein Cfor_00887 [Coptotermes formosanus]|uniref:Splicing factor 3B subunit 5 n=3 Tax=Blattodea TaxID=85823 RepID=A0A6L2PVV8_COPFO|nr:hypothetical protein Cfor_00887 [Coptotermes formosanus]
MSAARNQYGTLTTCVVQTHTIPVLFIAVELATVIVSQWVFAVGTECRLCALAECVIRFGSMGDRYNIHSQLEHLQSKYIGTGHADTTKFEWLVNQHRDSFASYMGHFDLLNFFAISENEAKARVRFNLMEKMLQPCGPPPEKPED